MVNPHQAEGEQILAVPTLVRNISEPILKSLGIFLAKSVSLSDLILNPSPLIHNHILHTPKKYQFILFVSGMSDKSVHALENLHKIGDAYFPEDYDIEIIDITRDKVQAVNYSIIGIPTLIKIAPDPMRIILGDLSDREKVLRILDITI